MCALTVPVNASSNVNNLVLQHVNQERARLGKSSLRLDSQLSNAAARRSQEIVQKFSHTRPNNKEWHSIYDEFNIFPLYIGENVAKKSYSTAPSDEQLALDFYNLWKNSPGHYQNMIKTEYDMIGLAIHKEGNIYYMTQLFNSGSKKQEAKPSNSKPEVKKEPPVKKQESSPSSNNKKDDKDINTAVKPVTNTTKLTMDNNEKEVLAKKEEARQKELKRKETEIKAKEEALKKQEEEQKKKEEEIRKKEEELLQKQADAEKQKRFFMGIAFAVVVVLITSFIGLKS